MHSKKKVSRKEMIVRVVCLIIIFLVLCIGGFILTMVQMFRLDIPTFTTWDYEKECFSYNGKTYYLIDETGLVKYETDKELGRIKKKPIIIHTVKGDPENSILIGHTIRETYIYSWKYKEIPSEGEITKVSLGDGYGETEIVYIEDKMKLKILKTIKNAKGEKITLSKQDAVGNSVGVYFYYEDCTVTYRYGDTLVEIIRLENGEWAYGNYDEDTWTGRKIEGKQMIALLESLAKEIPEWNYEVRKEESKKE